MTPRRRYFYLNLCDFDELALLHPFEPTLHGFKEPRVQWLDQDFVEIEFAVPRRPRPRHHQCKDAALPIVKQPLNPNPDTCDHQPDNHEPKEDGGDSDPGSGEEIGEHRTTPMHPGSTIRAFSSY
jgi:hypothetical protein